MFFAFTKLKISHCSCRTFEQTISFIEKVATTKIHEDIANLIAELGIQLRELELERKEDHKIVKLHPFEVASLANLIKAVSSYTFTFSSIAYHSYDDFSNVTEFQSLVLFFSSEIRIIYFVLFVGQVCY